MKNFKQYVIFAGLSAAFLSCTLQAMEKEEMPAEYEEVLALLLAGSEEETASEMPSFLRKADEGTKSRPKWQINQELVQQEQTKFGCEERARVKNLPEKSKSSNTSSARTKLQAPKSKSLNTGLYAITEDAKPRPKKTPKKKKTLKPAVRLDLNSIIEE